MSVTTISSGIEAAANRSWFKYQLWFLVQITLNKIGNTTENKKIRVQAYPHDGMQGCKQEGNYCVTINS